MKICKFCNKKYDDVDNFCSECGQKLIMFDTELLCPSCNKRLNKDMIYCPNCGTKVFSENSVELSDLSNNKNEQNSNLNNLVIKQDKDKIEYVFYEDRKIYFDNIVNFSFAATKHITNFYLNSYFLWRGINGDDSSQLFSIKGITTFKAIVSMSDGETIKCNFYKEKEYSEFINKIWVNCSSRIIIDLLKKLKDGNKVKIGNVVLSDEGIQFTQVNLFSKNEIFWYSWQDARSFMIIKHDGNDLRVEFIDRESMGGNIFFYIYLDSDLSPNIFESIYTVAFKYKVKKLSDLL